MRHASQYKTAFGLYKATIKALDVLSTTKKAWWIHAAMYHCEKEFPEMLPQLRELAHRPCTLEDLAETNEVRG